MNEQDIEMLIDECFQDSITPTPSEGFELKVMEKIDHYELVGKKEQAKANYIIYTIAFILFALPSAIITSFIANISLYEVVIGGIHWISFIGDFLLSILSFISVAVRFIPINDIIFNELALRGISLAFLLILISKTMLSTTNIQQINKGGI